ncbi:helix-turn-helix domain-containing protein [Bacillus sp. DTU_2020_1000418_1_SI_GHA_SEK_038]|uniref:helix-turn-helix domain-containing protein n=1 Tax=Bacillus sp. DTU_2020_1000418_1_SI_GHA_SEK_038 TaxID=3077585 RepID=UPI0028EFC5EF|nr:helix-turn-helix domain-containing protein [Bacillus sp. DTU_2020_1000418_1_SI_GHA_SEK_038]WNS75172.1 helix-turn-helix domain-containing protein [Bacillus sp. DTU_2020_1000418_1_SI_GHA_SEK_038]
MNIGNAVKAQRISKNLSVRELAARTGLSPGSISKIENGKTIPNVMTLKNIADAMEVPVAYFFLEEEEQLVQIIRKKDRPVLTRNISETGEVTEEMLSNGKDNLMQPCIITFSGGSHSGEAISHKGEDFIYVLKGNLLCVLEGLDRYELEEGDSMYFPSTIPHRWENLSKTEEAKIMVVASPASF